MYVFHPIRLKTHPFPNANIMFNLYFSTVSIPVGVSTGLFAHLFDLRVILHLARRHGAQVELRHCFAG
jgi:hypothetical protein